MRKVQPLQDLSGIEIKLSNGLVFRLAKIKTRFFKEEKMVFCNTENTDLYATLYSGGITGCGVSDIYSLKVAGHEFVSFI